MLAHNTNAFSVRQNWPIHRAIYRLQDKKVLFDIYNKKIYRDTQCTRMCGGATTITDHRSCGVQQESSRVRYTRVVCSNTRCVIETSWAVLEVSRSGAARSMNERARSGPENCWAFSEISVYMSGGVRGRRCVAFWNARINWNVWWRFRISAFCVWCKIPSCAISEHCKSIYIGRSINIYVSDLNLYCTTRSPAPNIHTQLPMNLPNYICANYNIYLLYTYIYCALAESRRRNDAARARTTNLYINMMGGGGVHKNYELWPIARNIG